MKELIITADDFGITRSVNEGIAMAFKEGVLTYASILPSGDAFDDAIRRAGELGLTEIGAHLALTETSCVSDPSAVPSLVIAGRRFNKGRAPFLLKFLLGLISREEAYIELKAQVERLRKTGISVTCLSGHEHIQLFPPILKVFISLAREYDIPAIRYMNDDSRVCFPGPSKYFKVMVQGLFRGSMKTALNISSIKHADHLRGFIDSGKIGEEEIAAILTTLPEGVTELVTHPGFIGPEVLTRYKFHKNCDRELSALTSPRIRSLIPQNNITLTTFGRIGKQP